MENRDHIPLWKKFVCTLCAFLIYVHPFYALANPQGGVVSAGQASISENNTTVRINQQSERAVIDWRSFDIAPGERTEFQQPSASSITLNRVNSDTASHIDGLLSANGNLVIINENGVVFGRGAQVDVNSLVASTADTSNENFMAGGKLILDKPGNPDASIVNNGTITAKEAGLVGFVAPRVENHGVITARMGRVHLASGDTATVDFYGDGLLEVAVSDNVSKQLVTNTGTISANGGLVAMTAAEGKHIVDSVINGKGTLQAKSVGSQSGKILIAGNKATDVIIDGLIDASGLGTSQSGGAVHILGNRIALMNNSSVNVSGNVGAGEILIGGDYHGGEYRGTLDKPVTAIEWGNTPGGYSVINRSPTAAFFAAYYAGLSKGGSVPTASRVFVDKNVVLNASGIAGNAGRVITWSNNGTAFYGHVEITAKGISGNGGFAEVSGKDWLSFAGTVDAKALHGRNGSLLLDPADITISTAPDSVITASSPFDSTGGATSNLNVTTLETALASGSVIISSAAGVGGSGDITFVDAVNWNSGNSLTVNASQHIYVNNTITNAGTGSVTLNAIIAPNGLIAINNNISTGGSVTALAMGDLTIAGGATVSTGATGGLSLRAANGVIGGTGNLTINGNIAVGTGTLTLVSGINGARPSLTLSGANFAQLGASVGVTSITGFQDVTLSTNFTGSGNITISPQRDFTLGASQTLSSGAGTIAILAQRNLTTNAGSTIATAATGSLSLQAANGSVAGTGNLSLGGNLSVGTGTLTLVSGVNGTRPSWIMDSSSFTMLGATVGVTSITGFQDVTVSQNFTGSGTVTISPQRDFILSASRTLATTGAITILAQRDITTGASSVISTGATGSLSLQAANASVAGTGNLTLGGNLSVGTGTLTLLSGINGTRPSLTLNGTNFTMLGATVGATSITGYQDVTLATGLTSSGNITISPQRDFILNASQTLAISSGASTISILAQRDITTGASSVISTGTTGSLSLVAANNSVAGTGNLTIGGGLSVGTGTLTLLSGINGTRPSLVINSSLLTMLGASISTITINGFQDITVSRAITGSGAITINPQRDFTLSASQTITGNGAITVLAQRDITLNGSTSISTGAAGSLSLRAANAVIAGTGNLTLNGSLSVGTGTLTLLSGINGTRPSWTMDSSSFTMLGATVGVTSITGFQDVTVSRNFTSSGNITISPQRDFALSASQTLAISSGASTINITALRDVSTGASSVISTGTTGSLTLRAANNVVAGTGNLTLGGKLSVGTGTLTLTSGINGTRPSWTINSTSFAMLGATVGVITINGFQDVTQSANITSSGAITINPQRDYILSASNTLTSGGAGALTILTQRDLIANASSIIATGSTGSLSLRAANGSTAGTGNLTLGGNISVGTGTLTLLSGINGTRPSWTMDATTFTMLGASVSTTSITGFQDMTVDRNFTGSGAVTINTNRDFILSASRTLASGGAGAMTILALRDVTANANSVITTGVSGALSVRAANGSTAGTGNLTLLGNLSLGTGGLTLVSGINGTRPSWTMNTTTFTTLGATVGAVSITGFLDYTLDRDLTSSSTMGITAVRDLTINSTYTLTGGSAAAFTLLAANNVVGGTGRLTINGNLSAGSGNFTLLSGINGTRPTWTADVTTLAFSAATVGAFNIQGFANITLARPVNSTSTITISNNTLTVLGDNITSTGSQTFSNTTTIAEGASVALTSSNAAIGFSVTLNGTAGGAAENLSVNSGTGTVTFTGIVGGTAPLGDLSVIADNLTISANLNGSGALTLQPSSAARIIVLGGAQANNLTTNGFNLSSAEAARIVAGWSSVGIGNTTSGSLTNSYATWLNPTSFITGSDFTNSVAINASSTVFVNAVQDIILSQSITTTDTSANAITLVAGRNFTNSFGANALVTGAGGRWLVYSTNPTDSTGEELLSNAFNRYTCTYGGACPTLSSGNGLLYSYTPLLDVTIDPQTYNYGDAVIAPTGYTLSTSGYLNALDLSQGAVGGTGNFTTDYVQGNNAGTGFTITNNGSTFSSNLGYGFNYVSPTGLTVGTRSITLQVSDQTVTYGNSLNTNAYSVTSGSFYNTDAAGLVLSTNATTSSSGNYNYSATPWSLTATGANFTSGSASNYSITYVAAPTGLTVNQRSLAVTATGADRVYNGLAGATVTLGDDRVAGDVLTTSYTAANFGDKNVGTGKSISVTGIGLTGTDSGNYTYNTSTTASADITQRSLTISATGSNRVYNGLAGATVTLGDDRVAGDVLTTSYTAANFGDKNVGTGKSISVTGIGLTGTDSGNYSFNTTATASADITQRSLTISATGSNRVYNGLAGATVTLGDDRVAGDVLTTSYTAANFGDKNVGTGKSISVTGIGLTGTDSGNYTYNTSTTASASITKRALTISATGTDRVYNGLTSAAVTLADNRLAGDVLTASYAAANFTNKHVGIGKSISVTGIGLTGTDSGNYSFNTTATASADITQRSLTISATGSNRVYNGLAGATVTLGDDRVAGDVLTTSYTAANFGDKNVGIGKAISVSGLSLSGADSADYVFNTTATASADVTQRALLISAVGTNKNYDGTVGASVTLSDNRITGDVLSTSYTAATFADQNAGTSKPISVTGIILSGADSANYSYNSFATAYASIIDPNAPTVVVVVPTVPVLVPSIPGQAIVVPLAMQIPNTVKKSLQDPLPAVNVDHLPEFLLFDDEWQKRQHRLPRVGMLR